MAALAEIARPAPGRSLDVDDWLRLSEEGPGELVAGRLEEGETPDAVHEHALGWLIWLFRNADAPYVKVVARHRVASTPYVPGRPERVVDLDALWSELAR